MDRYEEIQNYVNELIDDIENMKFYEHKYLCLFSLIETFAQNYSSYPPKGTRKCFSDFILKFSDKEKYSYLDEVDPVTLNYDLENKAYKPDELSDGNIYIPSSSSIVQMRNKLNFNNIPSSIKNNHKYINLIYNVRSKTSHEGQSAGIIKWSNENEMDTPIYMDFTSYWRLLFPYTFLRNLFLNCINNYLDYQKEKGADPFDNNFDRKSFFAFYDN